MSNALLLAPPFAFAIAILAALGISFALSRLRYKGVHRTDGSTESYACGENVTTHMIQPDYGQFLPFAFFFTILHVAALTVATVQIQSRSTLVFALLYVLGAMVGLSVLYRR